MRIELQAPPKVLSFDCYGTLIDWEAGILSGVRSLLRKHGLAPSDGLVLKHYAELEAEVERGPYQPYKEVLRAVVVGLGERLGFHPSAAETGCLVDSFGDWRPFPDTVPVLRALAEKFRLVILSNTDDDLFALTRPHLDLDFDLVITAEQLRSYKPSPANFAALVDRTGGRVEDLLHVAESLFHDIAPARATGLRTVWVKRPKRFGASATPISDAEPDFAVADLHSLSEALSGEGFGRG